jgi:hypothetical protein
VDERQARLGDRRNEDEVEEQLEPRRTSLLFQLERPQARRVE